LRTARILRAGPAISSDRDVGAAPRARRGSWAGEDVAMLAREGVLTPHYPRRYERDRAGAPAPRWGSERGFSVGRDDCRSSAAKVSSNSSRMSGSAREQERCLGSGSPGVRMRSVGSEGPALRVRDLPRVGRS
jgi:hypothetical protein